MDDAQVRKRLAKLIGKVEAILEPAFERTPVVRGRVYERRYRCNQPNCRCQTGEPHCYISLATWGDGKKDTYSIPPGEQRKLTKWCEDYRRLRQARVAVGRWAKEAAALIDEIESRRRVDEKEIPRGVGRAADERSGTAGKKGTR